MASAINWAALASTIAISACGSNSGAKRDAAAKVTTDNSTDGTRANVKTVLAAVEPFEALAETAIAAPPAELAHSIAAVGTAVRSIEAIVPGGRRLAVARRRRQNCGSAQIQSAG